MSRGSHPPIVKAINFPRGTSPLKTSICSLYTQLKPCLWCVIENCYWIHSQSLLQGGPILVEVLHSSPAQTEFIEFPPIEFWVNGNKGIRLLDALQDVFVGLADPHSEVLHAASAKISYRIEVISDCNSVSIHHDKLSSRISGPGIRHLQNRNTLAGCEVCRIVRKLPSRLRRYLLNS